MPLCLHGCGEHAGLHVSNLNWRFVHVRDSRVRLQNAARRARLRSRPRHSLESAWPGVAIRADCFADQRRQRAARTRPAARHKAGAGRHAGRARVRMRTVFLADRCAGAGGPARGIPHAPGGLRRWRPRATQHVAGRGISEAHVSDDCRDPKHHVPRVLYLHSYAHARRSCEDSTAGKGGSRVSGRCQLTLMVLASKAPPSSLLRLAQVTGGL